MPDSGSGSNTSPRSAHQSLLRPILALFPLLQASRRARASGETANKTPEFDKAAATKSLLPPAMNTFFGAARTGLLGGVKGSGSLQDVLQSSPSGMNYLQDLLAKWLKLDVPTVLSIVTIFGMMSGALPLMQSGIMKVYWWVTRFFTASISIAANDRLNREVLNWLGATVLPRRGTRILTARSEMLESDAWHYRRHQRHQRDDVTMEKRVPIQYLPTFGTTWFVYERNIFIVRRIPTALTSSGIMGDVPDEYAAAPEGDEPLVVMCLGRSVGPIKRFLDNCRVFADHQRDAYVTVRACREKYGEHSWDTTILRPLRPLETVHFDQETKDSLVADIENYLDPSTRRFYQARGIPYRRGYLLHGPPGTGKTSLSLALAGRFGLELYLLHIPSLRSDTELESLFTVLPPRCFILLEDIDAVGIKRRVRTPTADDSDDEGDGEGSDSDDDADAPPRCRCTLSGLLNVIDGVASQEGRIVLMTSNFAERLDHALVRPGRIDRMLYLGHISPKSAEGMFLRMYLPDSEHGSKWAHPGFGLDAEGLAKLAAAFGAQIPDATFTPAQLQGYLLAHRDEPRAAAAKVGAWAAEEMTRMAEAKAQAKIAAQARKRRKAKLAKLAAENAAVHVAVAAGKTAMLAAQKASSNNGNESRAGSARKKGKPSEEEGSVKTSGSVETTSEEPSEPQTPGTPETQFEKIEHPGKLDTEEVVQV